MCGGGGDGGYSRRQDQMRAEQDAAIASVNNIFGRGRGDPIYRTTTTPAMGGGSFDGEGNYTYGPTMPARTTQSIVGYDTAERDRNLAEREALYGTIMQDSEARLLDQLGDDRTDAERQVRFQLARQGLAGGSADIDQGREILEQFQEGSLEARQAALGGANTARSADERTRVGLINNIRQGMAESDALSAAYAGMQNNANAARDQAMTTDIGNFFDDLTMLRAQQQYQQGLQAARSQYPGGRTGTSAGSGGFNGYISGG